MYDQYFRTVGRTRVRSVINREKEKQTKTSKYSGLNVQSTVEGQLRTKEKIDDDDDDDEEEDG